MRKKQGAGGQLPYLCYEICAAACALSFDLSVTALPQLDVAAKQSPRNLILLSGLKLEGNFNIISS